MRLRGLLLSGAVDSSGLAFGWTIVLLLVTRRGGLDAAAVQSAAMLVGVALSAPFSAWLSRRLSPRDLLRALALAEGASRLGVFLLLWAQVDPRALAPLVVAMNVFAWSAYAGMRAEVSRVADADGGRSLTWYAVVIASSEALAAGAAALVLDGDPPLPVMVVIAVGYVLSLVPQWWVGTHASSARPDDAAPGLRAAPVRWRRAVAGPAALGGGVFALAAAPALLATALAYELYGTPGVVVSALAFTTGSLGASRVQAALGGWRPPLVPALLLGAVMVGGWSLSGFSLVGLAVAQVCAGLAQCSLEGELDARAAAVSPAGTATTALAVVASSRALGGALAVAVLPELLGHASLPALSLATGSGLLLTATVVSLWSLARMGRSRRTRISPSFTVGYAAGVVTAGALRRFRHRPGDVRSSTA